MAQGKKSFVAYSDWKDIFNELPDEDAGKLIKHVFAYVNDENPVSDSVLIKAVFATIKSTLKRDLDKWDKELEQRKEAGIKSGISRRTKTNERSTVVNETERKRTDSVSVNVSDSVSVNDFLLEKETKESIVIIPERNIIDFEHIVDLFNKICIRLPSVQKVSLKRKNNLKARIDEYGLEGLGNVFNLCSQSDFLNGANSTGWTANFDWIIKSENFIKIKEGNYKNKTNGGQQKSTTEQFTDAVNSDAAKNFRFSN